MPLTFGDKIKTARKSKKLTQRQLAEKIGAKHNSISDWENDKNKPDPDTIEILCGVLEITPNYLLDTLSSSDELSPLEKSIIKKYRLISQSDIAGRTLVDSTVEYIYDKINIIQEKNQSLADIQAQLTAKDSKITELEASLNNAPKKPERKDPESEKINQIPFKSNDEPTDEDIDLLIARNGKPLSNKDKKRLIMLMSEIE